MAREIDVIYLGADNVNEILLKKDGVPQDLSSVTKIELHFSDDTDVTNTTGTVFPIKWLGLSRTGLVQLQLGDENLSLGDLTAKMLTYDPVNTDGIVWSGQNGIQFFVTLAT